ncbi:hypothetical protein [Pseudomonas sp. PE-S1G-1]|uniref:hypothetical protein n=1 Tax=Pseudomonas sp. PE-S1G-1 TaxID=1986995 RepID=UPI00117BD1A5|nr:hypothetical protein [Pseudomonas sp. PE-S1G-1]
MNTAQLAIQHYRLAKDGNRPHLNTLPASDLGSVMSWVSGLSYPWCSPQAAVSEAPDIDGIGEVLQCLAAL